MFFFNFGKSESITGAGFQIISKSSEEDQKMKSLQTTRHNVMTISLMTLDFPSIVT
jgi:hypothetical protein